MTELNKSIAMGTLGGQFQDGNYQSITLCLTEECNLSATIVI